MILYFTGTGNTEFAARYIAEKLNDEVISLNDVIKQKKELRFRSERPFVVAAPVYAWRFPTIIEELLRKAVFSGNRKIYYIGTMASQTGNCGRYLMRLTMDKKMEFMGFCGIAMPNNYIIGGKLPDKNEADSTIEAALPVIEKIAVKIAATEKIEKNDKTPFAAIASGAVNAMFNKFMIGSVDFNVSDDCVSCGKCADSCPVNNIVMENGRPSFGRKCLNCYACINRCPAEAVNIGNKTQNNGRYVCPDYSEWKKSESHG